MEGLQKQEQLTFVCISDLWLNSPKTLRGLREILDKYVENDFLPKMFIFCGNFTSKDIAQGSGLDLTRYQGAQRLNSFKTLPTCIIQQRTSTRWRTSWLATLYSRNIPTSYSSRDRWIHGAPRHSLGSLYQNPSRTGCEAKLPKSISCQILAASSSVARKS